jgi:hypothetical protein
MSSVVSVARVASGWECEVTDRGLRARVSIATQEGLLVATGVAVVSEERGGALAAGTLSKAPYARWIRAAQDAVGRQPSGKLKRADFLAVEPFLRDRRGKTPRSDRDFADLAALYVSKGHSLARDLATRYPQVSLQTWRNHLTRAKPFTHVVHGFDADDYPETRRELTDEAMRLIYGADYLDRFADAHDEDEAARRRVEKAENDYRGAIAYIHRWERARTWEQRHQLRRRYGIRNEARAAEWLVEAKKIVANYGG